MWRAASPVLLDRQQPCSSIGAASLVTPGPFLAGWLAGCRARSPEDIRRRQAALERERLKFFYPEPHHVGESATLGAIVIKNMCARARRQAALARQ